MGMSHICAVADSRRLQIYRLREQLRCKKDSISGRNRIESGVVLEFGTAGISHPYISECTLPIAEVTPKSYQSTAEKRSISLVSGVKIGRTCLCFATKNRYELGVISTTVWPNTDLYLFPISSTVFLSPTKRANRKHPKSSKGTRGLSIRTISLFYYDSSIQWDMAS